VVVTLAAVGATVRVDIRAVVATAAEGTDGNRMIFDRMISAAKL
jgi:hypothetical protein